MYFRLSSFKNSLQPHFNVPTDFCITVEKFQTKIIIFFFAQRHTMDQEEDIIYSLIDLTNCLNADLYGAINEYQKIFDKYAD